MNNPLIGPDTDTGIGENFSLIFCTKYSSCMLNDMNIQVKVKVHKEEQVGYSIQ